MAAEDSAFTSIVPLPPVVTKALSTTLARVPVVMTLRA
ncbi:hypothetical protein HPGCJGGD_3732 [Methylobacterium haplocladii]|nr:hypothetical protein HPGCJGGD_3732 [Methylobacterium haplocladii]